MSVYALGENSYEITYSKGTSSRVVFDSLRSICAERNGQGKLKHGWEFLASAYDFDLNSWGKTRVDLLVFSSDCLPDIGGGKKYIIFCASKVEVKREVVKGVEKTTYGTEISVMSTNSWDYQKNWFNSIYGIRGRFFISMGYAGWPEYVGRQAAGQTIPDSNFSLFLFINPQWFALSISSKTKYVSNADITLGTSSKTENFGVTGVFELFSGTKKSALFCTALFTVDQALQLASSDAEVGDYYTGDASGISVAIKGESCNYGDISYYHIPILSTIGILTSHKHRGKPRVVMLDLNQVQLIFGSSLTQNSTRLGSIHGLKHCAPSNLVMGNVKIKCDDVFTIDDRGTAKTHFVLPAWNKFVGTAGGQYGNFDSFATFLLPA